MSRFAYRRLLGGTKLSPRRPAGCRARTVMKVMCLVFCPGALSSTRVEVITPVSVASIPGLSLACCAIVTPSCVFVVACTHSSLSWCHKSGGVVNTQSHSLTRFLFFMVVVTVGLLTTRHSSFVCTVCSSSEANMSGCSRAGARAESGTGDEAAERAGAGKNLGCSLTSARGEGWSVSDVIRAVRLGAGESCAAGTLSEDTRPSASPLTVSLMGIQVSVC